MAEETKLKTYRVPCTWQLYGHIEVEAESLQDAVDEANGDGTNLPSGSYIEGSYEVLADDLAMAYPDEFDNVAF